ncbi:MAG TPA: aryl-sulfate sulfotransferase [Gemmataceae bacterium]|nr:aryl-sulfate sulfotransferase [Gemmataceae bacterium]
MWLSSILNSLSPSSPHTRPRRRPAPRQRRAAHRLTLEALEERSLPSCMVSLAPSEAAPQLVGERIAWTATATDCGATPVYQFSAATDGGAFRVLRDFSPTNTFPWTPMQEGAYDIEVTVKDGYQAAETTSTVVSDAVASRVTGSEAVITPTLNPLVVLYSAPPSSAGSVFVQFSVAGDSPSWRNTNTLPVVPGKSTNFFVAGMLPNTTYEMRDVLSDGTGSVPLLFTTGALPTTLTFPTYTVRQEPGLDSDLNQDMTFHTVNTLNGSAIPNPVATDLMGRVVWYYDTQTSGLGITNMTSATLLPRGTVLGFGNDRDSVRGNRNVLREIDLAGNPVRETNIAAVNAQLKALGHDIIYGFLLDAQRLPNGSTVVEGVTERMIDVNGTPTNYVGVMILVLDQDFQVTWAWDAFDHLNTSRGPVLGEILQPGSPLPTAVVPDLPAVDWLHANAVSLSPADGNLILSVRLQDWVIKIDYENGAGDGHVVWKLGKDGDFKVNFTDPKLWFSHQHNAHYIDDSTLILFDNGNTRRASDPHADSRGQVWKLDEKTMTATLVLNADLGNYSPALGAAQRLSNGDFSFTSGRQGQPANPFGQSIEVRPDGSKAYVLEIDRYEFRSFRVRTLYEGVDDALAGAPQTVDSVVLNDGSAQRSMVNSITVTFSGAAILDSGAIELRRQDGSLVGLHTDISILGGKTVAVLTFVGPDIIGGSLADGSYTLTVRADRVHDRWGRELDGDGNGSAGGDRVDSFFRLFGDSNGDGHVDALDRDLFRSAFKKSAGEAGYLWYFDFDGDGDVDGRDNGQFNRRFGQH